jgi:hypothetical protein
VQNKHPCQIIKNRVINCMYELSRGHGQGQEAGGHQVRRLRDESL